MPRLRGQVTTWPASGAARRRSGSHPRRGSSAIHGLNTSCCPCCANGSSRFTLDEHTTQEIRVRLCSVHKGMSPRYSGPWPMSFRERLGAHWQRLPSPNRQAIPLPACTRFAATHKPERGDPVIVCAPAHRHRIIPVVILKLSQLGYIGCGTKT